MASGRWKAGWPERRLPAVCCSVWHPAYPSLIAPVTRGGSRTRLTSDQTRLNSSALSRHRQTHEAVRVSPRFREAGAGSSVEDRYQNCYLSMRRNATLTRSRRGSATVSGMLWHGKRSRNVPGSPVDGFSLFAGHVKPCAFYPLLPLAVCECLAACPQNHTAPVMPVGVCMRSHT